MTLLTHKEQVIILDIDESTEIEETMDMISFVVGPGCVAPAAIKLRASYNITASRSCEQAVKGRETKDRMG